MMMFCPRCGAEQLVIQKKLGPPEAPCRFCTWKIRWVGPLWGEAKR